MGSYYDRKSAFRFASLDCMETWSAYLVCHVTNPEALKQGKLNEWTTYMQFTKCTRGKQNEQLFPRKVVIQLPKYAIHITGEPKYKYGQQEQVTVRNHNRNTALERSVLNYLGLKTVLRVGYPNFAISFSYRSKHLVSCSIRVKVF